jgi:hypothetical protein
MGVSKKAKCFPDFKTVEKETNRLLGKVLGPNLS